MKKQRFWISQENWYKGNLHTHTNNSDGTLSIKKMIKMYYVVDDYREANYY